MLQIDKNSPTQHLIQTSFPTKHLPSKNRKMALSNSRWTGRDEIEKTPRICFLGILETVWKVWYDFRKTLCQRVVHSSMESLLSIFYSRSTGLSDILDFLTAESTPASRLDILPLGPLHSKITLRFDINLDCSCDDAAFVKCPHCDDTLCCMCYFVNSHRCH